MPDTAATRRSPSNTADVDTFSLEEYFPYQVRCFYAHVTTVVSRCYSERYGMSPPEWRTMASLGTRHQLTSAQIAAQSRMDKVTVCRAVAKLGERGWLLTKTHRGDGRRKLLQLSAAGKKIYRQLVPQVLAAEQTLLDGLTPAQIDALKSMMAQIGENGHQLQPAKASR